jgi:hypothetical protein
MTGIRARRFGQRFEKHSKTKTRTTFSFVASRAASFTPPKIASVAQGKIMTNSIADASVALSLMLEALSLLDGPEHSNAEAHLRNAIDELRQEPASPRGAENSGGS